MHNFKFVLENSDFLFFNVKLTQTQKEGAGLHGKGCRPDGGVKGGKAKPAGLELPGRAAMRRGWEGFCRP